MLYLEVPAAAEGSPGVRVSPALIWAGLIVLAAAVPAGLAFGLLSTRRLTRRLKGLAALTLEVADGDFQRRVRVSGHDEVSLLLALRPVALEEARLAGAIEGVCRAYSERLGIPVHAEFEPAGLGPAGLSPAVEHAVLRVTQEAVANAARHADPGQVTVRLRADSRRVELEIADDGRGFDVPARSAGAGGLGLHTMHDRVTELGGRLTIDSAPSAGTRVRVCLPLREAGVIGAASVQEAR